MADNRRDQTRELKRVNFVVASTAAKIGNERLRQELGNQQLDLMGGSIASAALSKLARNKEWNPLYAQKGKLTLGLSIRMENFREMNDADYGLVQEIVTDSLQQAIMKHKADWTTVMLRDLIAGDPPHFNMRNTYAPSRPARLVNWIQGKLGR